MSSILNAIFLSNYYIIVVSRLFNYFWLFIWLHIYFFVCFLLAIIVVSLIYFHLFISIRWPRRRQLSGRTGCAINCYDWQRVRTLQGRPFSWKLRKISKTKTEQKSGRFLFFRFFLSLSDPLFSMCNDWVYRKIKLHCASKEIKVDCSGVQCCVGYVFASTHPSCARSFFRYLISFHLITFRLYSS